ncbi:phosphatidate cytidylyltransferase [Aerococcaceae bacterium NML191219]|nr:phosphatidate cytidylyltransferase [Aerococcaceae bacterium NML191219]
MRIRTLSAAVGLLILLPLMYIGGYWFAWFTFLLGAIGVFEIARMKGIDYISLVGVISTIAVGFVLVPEHYWYYPITQFNYEFIFYICCMILLALTVYKHQRLSFVDVAVLMFGALYVGHGFRYLIIMRDLGFEVILFLFIVMWATDTGAYIFGRFFGKNPLAPAISPNKTVEGAVGGVFTAVIASIVYVETLKPYLAGIEHYIWLTIFLSIAGQMGDLVESAYKRHFGVKDSGKILPGHGGVLDRFDSTIFASIMFMIWLNLMK